MKKFSKNFSKISLEANKDRKVLEKTVKDFDRDIPKLGDNREYLTCNKLMAIYDDTVNGIKVRSRCDWFKYGEKSSNILSDLEKHRATKSQIRSIFYNEIINNFSKINNSLLYNLFRYFCKGVLNKLTMPQLSFEELQLYEGTIKKDEIFKTSKSMKNNKSPANDGPKEFYETFWASLAEPFLNFIKTAKLNNELSSSQKQAVIAY